MAKNKPRLFRKIVQIYATWALAQAADRLSSQIFHGKVRFVLKLSHKISKRIGWGI